MITSLNEINRVLLALRRLTKQRKSVSRGILADFLNGAVILAQNPDFEPVLNFSVRLGVISIRQSGVSIVMREPVMIQNPHARLKSDPRFQIQPHNMLVKGNVCGNLMTGKVRANNK